MKKKVRMMKARIAYLYARMKAERLGRLSGRRQYVLMTDSGKLVVMDRRQFYRLRKGGCMPRAITPRMLPRVAVYYTAGPSGGVSVPCMPPSSAVRRKRRYLEYVRSLD